LAKLFNIDLTVVIKIPGKAKVITVPLGVLGNSVVIIIYRNEAELSVAVLLAHFEDPVAVYISDTAHRLTIFEEEAMVHPAVAVAIGFFPGNQTLREPLRYPLTPYETVAPVSGPS